MNMRNVTLVAALVAATVSGAACKDSRAGYTTTTTTKDGTSVVEYTYEQRDAFRTEVGRAIDKLEARSNELRAKATQGGQTVKAETQELLDDAKEGIANLRADMARAGTVTREEWNDFRRDFSSRMDALGRRIEAAFKG
jgi:hypothetical protein